MTLYEAQERTSADPAMPGHPTPVAQRWSRAAVVAEARSWVGTRWAHQCMLKGFGCDCIGLVGGVGYALGMPSAEQWYRDADAHNYGREPDPVVLRAFARRYLSEIPIVGAGLGDILLFEWLPGRPMHFGIVSNLKPMQIVHAYASARKVCENGIDGKWRQDQTWRSLIAGAWRYRELAD